MSAFTFTSGGHDFDWMVTCRNCGYQASITEMHTGILPACVELEVELETVPIDRCACGSHKALGIGKGKPGHSSWCPWSQP